ncbi:transposase [Eilatimonas milleporae]|uniref:Putative transposase of IS4/5 family DUF4096 n=1 Tax=Eilatimonas milleporae TaxID=911205 RepID=A0A3M0C7R1_9PROT|nr:putative transposase of IS4/5 family DUF4096 [Eilatimonas milleporae]
MSDLFLLSPAQMSKIEPFFPRSHGAPCVDDRRVSVISGIVYVLKHGLQWKGAPRGYGPHVPSQPLLQNQENQWLGRPLHPQRASLSWPGPRCLPDCR